MPIVFYGQVNHLH